MSEHYTHLSAEERAIVQLRFGDGFTIRAIARELQRAPSSISRELARNGHEKPYNATKAAVSYRQRRRASVRPKKLREGEPLYDRIRSMLEHRQWSPEQMAERLKLEKPDDPDWHVSHETIYSTIYAYPRNELRKHLIAQLRQHKAKRGTRRKTQGGGALPVPDDQTIHARPIEIEGRLTPGHWEGDLIAGSMNRSCVGTVVERQTGFVVLCKMDSKNAEDVRAGFERQLKKIDSFLRLSMTYDRGTELAQHPLMSKRLKMAIYFADPHAPWQRGSNENINGLIRQYLPKGMDLSDVSQTTLNDIAWLLNTRPRKRFKWQTPQELFDQVIADHINGVALES